MTPQEAANAGEKPNQKPFRRKGPEKILNHDLNNHGADTGVGGGGYK